MSEEGGGKIKIKRQYGSSKPYERRKSLFGKVKDLITPSWLSSLVATTKPEEKEKHKDDKFMSPVMSPPLIRLQHQQNDMKPPPPVFVPLDKRNGTPSKVSAMAPPQSTVIAHAKPGESVPALNQDQLPVQIGFTSSQLPLIPEKVHIHHHEDNDDNISDKSDHSKSTSGCSSMIPHPPSTTQKERVMQELNESDLSSMKDKLVDSSEIIQPKTGRSLTWSAQYNTKRPKRPALQGRPSFDISLFGSPVAGGNSSLLSDRLHESTFYPGRTTYGGAASQRRQSLGSTAPYQSSFPVRQKMKAKPMNNSFSSSATTSGTARKILETLEKMTTPLGDARKIPVDDTVMQSLSSSFSFTPSSYRRPTRHSIGSYLNSSRELQIPSKGPPLKKVSTPGSASLAVNLQRFNTPEMDKGTHSNTDATSSYQLPGSFQREQSTPLSSIQGGKMKSKKFSQHVPSSRKDDEDELPYEIPKLRTDFTLPVKDMPAFNFTLPKSTPQSSVRPSTDSSSVSYTFSSPIQKMPVTRTDTPTGPPKKEFKFSSPIQGDGSTSPHKTKSVTFDLEDNSPLILKTPAVSSNDISTSVSKGFPKPASTTGASSNSPFTGGFKVATELKSGSVMDILGKSDNSESKSSEAVPKKNSFSQFAPKGWTCDVCLITNKDDVDKCVACTTPKPGAKPSLPKNDSLAKFAAKGWTCDSCLVSNKDDAEKCIACTANKPGLKKGLSKSQSNSGGSLQSVFKKPSGNWDCDVCLVPNKEGVTKCIACESPRPGTQPSSSGGFKIAPGAFSGQSGFVIPTESNSNSNSGIRFGGDSKSTSQSGTGFKFGGDSTPSTEIGFKFGDSTVKALDNTDKSKSGLVVENSVSDQKEKSSTGGFVFGKPNSLSADIPVTSTKAEFSNKSLNELCKPKTSIVVENSIADNKPTVGGFSFGKTSESLDKGGISFGKSEKSLDSGTNLSVSTSTVATTGLLFTSSLSDTKATASSFSFGQSTANSSTTGQKLNGGFVFGQTASSNKDSTSDIKTTSANSVFTDTKNVILGSDPKTSISSFTGTNNSGFSFNKQENKESEIKPVFNTQSKSVSPSLKRGRDDENGPSDMKKQFTLPSTASSTLFQFGTKITANASAPTSVFAFGQNTDKPSPFSASSVNFGGTATSSTTGFNVQSTSTISNFTGTTGTVFGKTTSVTSSSAGSNFVFGASSTKPATTTTSTFGTSQQTPSMFGNNSSSFGSNKLNTGPSFGISSNNASFSNTSTAPAGGFGSTSSAFGSSSTNPPFGAPQTSSAPIFGAQSNTAFGAGQSSTPGFGTPQTSSGPTFGLSQAPSFGAAAPAASTTQQGGFNFSSTPSFNFGQTAAPTQPGGSIFQFGGPKPAETPQQAPTGGFNFNQTPSTPGGAPFSFSATPAQSFGGTAGFGQPSTPQQPATPGMFSIGTGGSADNRKIKKAVRKIKR